MNAVAIDPELLAQITPENAEAFFYARYDEAIRLLCPDYDEMMQTLAQAVPPEAAVVVDLGCGTGALLDRLARTRRDVQSLVGIDLNPWLLGEARHKLIPHPHVALLEGDLRVFPLPAATAMVSSLVMHNLAPVDQVDLYQRVARATACFLQFDSVAGGSPAEEDGRWSYLRWWFGEQGLPVDLQDLALCHIRGHDQPLTLAQHRQAAGRAGLDLDTITVAPGFAVMRATRRGHVS